MFFLRAPRRVLGAWESCTGPCLGTGGRRTAAGGWRALPEQGSHLGSAFRGGRLAAGWVTRQTAAPGAKGLGVGGFGVSEQVPGEPVPGAALVAGREGSVVRGSVPAPSDKISSPWDPSSTRDPGSKRPVSSRRQRTQKVLLVAREIGGKALSTSVSLLITALNDVLKIFLVTVE